MILHSHPSEVHGWSLVAAPGCLLALPADAAARVDGIAERLAGDDGFRTALELLIAGGIASAPDFALIDGNSTVARVVLRGDAKVVVTSDDPDVAELTISGAGVSTWSERVLEGARSLRLHVPGSTWTVRLGPASEHADASPLEPAPATAESAVVAPVAEVTLVPTAEIEVPRSAPPVASALAPQSVSESVTVPQVHDEGPEPYDFLFGNTVYRTQSGANPEPERSGDHDGRTVLADELGLHGHVPASATFPERPQSAQPPQLPGTSEVPDSTFVAPIPGHLPAAAQPVAPAAPPVPTLQLERADGSREQLARPVLIGRAPSASSAASGPAPRLITILDDKDISRSHLRVAVEGDAVVVTDLASKNGTIVTLPGGSPRKLREGEPTVVLPGTLIDLGGGVTFTVRED